MAGRIPKPTRLKVLEGLRGHRKPPPNEPQPPSGIPRMPRWLRAFPEAVKEWREGSRELDQMGILTTADGTALAEWAYLGSQIQKLTEDIRVEGYTIQSGKETKRNPKVADLKAFLSERRARSDQLGFSPSSRARLRVPEKKPVSKFEGLTGAAKNAQG